MSRSRIVIVEDDLLIARTIQRKLEQAGYQVLATLTSGQEAVGAMPGLAPDLVLMDIELEGPINGIQAGQEIGLYSDVPIIYLTAYADDETVGRARLAAPYGYILKPFRERELLSNIEIALNRHRMEQQLRAREAELRAVFDGVQNLLLVVDHQCRIVQANQAAIEALGSLDESPVGRQPGDVLGCLNALSDPRGCGAGPACAECAVRRTILDTLHTGRAHRQVQATLPVQDQEGRARTWQISTTLIGNRPTPSVLVSLEEITARKQAEQERDRLIAQIRNQARQLGDVLNAVPEGVLLLDTDRRILLANAAARQDLAALSDVREGQILTGLGGVSLDRLLTWPQDPTWHEVQGGNRTFEVIGRPVHLEPDQQGWVLVIRDMTREREMQARIRQQDRLAVLGQLVGGIAHDFNNLLTAIKGYTEFALDELSPDHVAVSELREVRRAADRAAALTGQLLVFSRKKMIQPSLVSLDDTINDMSKMLRRLIGENICLALRLQENLPYVLADPGQIEQVVMNLCVNARDALPAGGEIVIQTATVTLDVPNSVDNLPAGIYVTLSVSDNGIGMPPEVKAHLFEPFFTTKSNGTGLGLSVVWGVVRQCGGYVEVDSEVGQGTTFRIYLPAVEQADPLPSCQNNGGVMPVGSETVLVVEDDAAVRALIDRTLTQLGYAVFSTSQPAEALVLAKHHTGHIALLIADVVMPEMSGFVLAERLADQLPGLRTLYISGYTDEEIRTHYPAIAELELLRKPFDAQTLACKVREMLDGS